MYFPFMSLYIIDWLSLMVFLSSLREVFVGSHVVIVVVKLLLLMKSIIFMVFLLINYKRVAFISFCTIHHYFWVFLLFFNLKFSFLFYPRPYCTNCFKRSNVWKVVLCYSQFDISCGPVPVWAVDWVLFQPLGQRF